MFTYIIANEWTQVRPIRHSHGELKDDENGDFHRVEDYPVRPIRHSHGELKDEYSLNTR